MDPNHSHTLGSKTISAREWERPGVFLFTMTSPGGMSLTVSNFGAAIVSCIVPDSSNKFDDVLLGYGSLKQYMQDKNYVGTVVGRYANRIKNTRLTIDGKEYQLADNRNGFHHHGGFEGFNKKLFTARPLESDDKKGVKLTYTSKDGEEGYPGNLDLEVTYAVNDGTGFSVEYRALTDKPTVLNPTQHAYFNLGGHSSGSVEGQYLQLFADRWLVVDDEFIPTGEKRKVDGTVYDFRQPVELKSRIDAPEFANGSGFDNTWILAEDEKLKHAARAADPRTGRMLDVFTTEPSVHFYSGNFIENGLNGKNGAVYGRRSGFCLETQHFPDSPNHPGFPSTVLRPGKEFYSKTVFNFLCK